MFIMLLINVFNDLDMVAVHLITLLLVNVFNDLATSIRC